MTLDCGGIVGRYVSVIHPNKPLPLCEVQVYSTLVVPQNKVPQLPKPHGKQIIQFYEILLMQNSIQKRKGCHICRWYYHLHCNFVQAIVVVVTDSKLVVYFSLCKIPQ